MRIEEIKQEINKMKLHYADRSKAGAIKLSPYMPSLPAGRQAGLGQGPGWP